MPEVAPNEAYTISGTFPEQSSSVPFRQMGRGRRDILALRRHHCKSLKRHRNMGCRDTHQSVSSLCSKVNASWGAL